MDNNMESQEYFSTVLDQLGERAHKVMFDKGYLEQYVKVPKPVIQRSMLALLVEDVGEIIECTHEEMEESECCPGFTEMEIKAAEVLLHLLDLAYVSNLRLGDAVLAKLSHDEGDDYVEQ